jgi:hypothetical protein
LSEEQEEERIELDVDDNNDDDFERFDEPQPVEIIREEAVEVVQNLNGMSSLQASSSSTEDQNEEENEVNSDNRNSVNEDIYEQIKVQSIQLNRLADMVESLQSQVKQLLQTTRLPKHLRTRSVRKKSTSNKGIKTKKKTKRRGSARSRKK